MEFLTEDQFVKPMLKKMLVQLHNDYEQEVCEDDDISFDTWIFQNLRILGEYLYDEIGQRYGDCDDAFEELV